MALTPWLLDDTPFESLARVYDPTWGWPEHVIAVARAIAEGAKKSQLRAQLLGALDPNGRNCIEVLDGTAAETHRVLHTHLRTTTATCDFGEHESIAIALVEHTDRIFVTMDKRAAIEALNELGPSRVATPFDVWSDLHAKDLIDAQSHARLDAQTLKPWQGFKLPYRFAKLRAALL